MNCRCPNCGAVNSLDSLLANDDVRHMVQALADIGGELPKALLRYCGLFRPAQSQLTFARTAKLLGELLPDIRAQRIERNKQVFDAPPEAWVWGIGQMLDARDAQRLETPLKSHGYLYEVISKYRPGNTVLPASAGSALAPVAAAAATDVGLAGINKWRR